MKTHNFKKHAYNAIVGIMIFSVNTLMSQNVGINSTGVAPDASAMLDVVSTSKGLLIPRLALSAINNNAPIGAGVITSLLVYNTATAGSAPNNVTPGYYYWNGSVWVRFAVASTGSTGTAWDITGNASTVDGTNFIGTTDDIPFNFRINNTKAGRIERTYGHTFLGYRSGNSNSATTASTGNTGIGYEALYSNTSGFSHTAIGYRALYSVTNTWQNTAVGNYAGYSSNGAGNCFFGHNSGYAMTGVAASTFGYQCAQTATGAGVTVMGYQAIVNNLAGANNVTGIGSQCALTGNYGNVGVYGGAASVNANNKTRMGDASVTVYETQVAWTVPSDGRFKNSVTENVPGLEFIKKLRPVTYKFDTEKFDKFLNGDTKYMWERDFTDSKNIIHTGFIAQEVEKAAKECGYTFDGVHAPTNPKDNYGVAYSQFVMPLIKAVQEQQQMIEKQQSMIETQQKLMLEMKHEIQTLKNK